MVLTTCDTASISWILALCPPQFLVNRAGKPIKRYPPKMDKAVYEAIEKDLKGMLDV